MPPMHGPWKTGVAAGHVVAKNMMMMIDKLMLHILVPAVTQHTLFVHVYPVGHAPPIQTPIGVLPSEQVVAKINGHNRCIKF